MGPERGAAREDATYAVFVVGGAVLLLVLCCVVAVGFLGYRRARVAAEGAAARAHLQQMLVHGLPEAQAAALAVAAGQLEAALAEGRVALPDLVAATALLRERVDAVGGLYQLEEFLATFELSPETRAQAHLQLGRLRRGVLEGAFPPDGLADLLGPTAAVHPGGTALVQGSPEDVVGMIERVRAAANGAAIPPEPYEPDLGAALRAEVEAAAAAR